jgi:hypothetical protein
MKWKHFFETRKAHADNATRDILRPASSTDTKTPQRVIMLLRTITVVGIAFTFSHAALAQDSNSATIRIKGSVAIHCTFSSSDALETTPQTVNTRTIVVDKYCNENTDLDLVLRHRKLNSEESILLQLNEPNKKSFNLDQSGTTIINLNSRPEVRSSVLTIIQSKVSDKIVITVQ